MVHDHLDDSTQSASRTEYDDSPSDSGNELSETTKESESSEAEENDEPRFPEFANTSSSESEGSQTADDTKENGNVTDDKNNNNKPTINTDASVKTSKINSRDPDEESTTETVEKYEDENKRV